MVLLLNVPFAVVLATSPMVVVVAVPGAVAVVVRAPVCVVRGLRVEPPAGRPEVGGDTGAVGDVGDPGELEDGPAAALLIAEKLSISFFFFFFFFNFKRRRQNSKGVMDSSNKSKRV